jgi:DNA helicase-2/ATP-dependent DNA helicase PcrA
MHGLWQTNIPSRFLDELPEGNVDVTEPQGGFGGFGGYGASRFDAATSFGSNYRTPGWQRAQAAKDPYRGAGGFAEDDARYDDSRYEMDDDEALHHRSPLGGGRAAGAGKGDRSADSPAKTSPRRVPLTIEGELVAKSTGTVSAFSLGDRVFHQKFGNGNITAIDGNKLTIQFDRAGEKRVVDSFVERV